VLVFGAATLIASPVWVEDDADIERSLVRGTNERW
jgi:hypothetical protein